MALNRVILAPPYFGDPDEGKPLFFASVFVGAPNLDPEIEANRKAVIFQQQDGSEVTIDPSEQPFNTGAGGYILYNGSTVALLTDGNYSIKVLDSNGDQEFYIANASEGIPIGSTDVFLKADNVDDMVNSSAFAIGDYVETPGYFTDGDGGNNLYIVEAVTVDPDDGGRIIKSIANPLIQFRGLFPDNIISPEKFGATTALSTTQIQNAIDFVPDGQTLTINRSHITGALTVNKPMTISGSGTLNQSVVSTITISVLNDDVNIEGIEFVGAAVAPSASLNDDEAIEILSVSRVNVTNCRFSNYSFNTVFVINCTDVKVSNCHFQTVAHAVRFRGTSRGSALGNTGFGTVLETTSQSIPFGADSTNGHAFGICEDINISNNTFAMNPYGEFVLVHAVRRMIIDGNIVNGFSFGVGVNPFNNQDTVQGVVISGNHFVGTNAIDWPTAQPSDADEAILVAGSLATTTPVDVTIDNNTVTGFNKVVDNSTQGGIVVGLSRDVNISNNIIRDCQANGVSVRDETEGLSITANLISSITFNVALTLKNGIYINNASADCFVDANVISDITGVNSFGIRLDAGFCYLGTNQYRSVDTPWGEIGGVLTTTRNQSYTAGTTVDLNGTDVVEFNANAGAIIIGAGIGVWSNVIANKTYNFLNVGTLNNVTISNDPTYCQTSSGLDVVLTPGDSVNFIGGSATNIVRQATTVVNNA